MPTVAEFREALRAAETDEIVDRYLLAEGARHVSQENIDKIASALSVRYGIEKDQVDIIITGSAKLGFSISEKRRRGKEPLPRYRSFSAMSDIDVAVISPLIFDLVWHEISAYSHRSTYFPWKADRLGDYLIVGWWRPDHFPKNVRLGRCDDWFDTFRGLSADRSFGRRRVNGGLYGSIEHLRQYMGRAVTQCKIAEDLN